MKQLEEKEVQPKYFQMYALASFKLYEFINKLMFLPNNIFFVEINMMPKLDLVSNSFCRKSLLVMNTMNVSTSGVIGKRFLGVKR